MLLFLQEVIAAGKESLDASAEDTQCEGLHFTRIRCRILQS